MAITTTDQSADPSRAVKLCGTETQDPPTRRLTAGSLSIELQNGQLRYVTYAGIEVLRGVAFLARDENWGTYSPEIVGLDIEEGETGFTIKYGATCADEKQCLVYEASISGSIDGSLSFVAVASPASDFVTNRTGFVVLHPAALAGRPVRVTHVDGREVEAHFPERISPSQPIFDIRALTHEAAPGLFATCRMEGDAFEMEDQRNWTDASYKTYVRPLALPWAYTLAKGSRHEQSVRLSFSGATGGRPRPRSRALTFELGAEVEVLAPRVGVAIPAEEAPATRAAIDWLRRLGPQFLVCNVDVRDGRGLDALPTCRRIADAVAATITLEIVLPDEVDAAAALRPIADLATQAQIRLEAVIVSSAADLKSWQPGAERPQRPTVEELAAAARSAFPGVKLGGGMLSTFTELNRKPPMAAVVDYVSHTTCSIVHAADDRSVMETLETLPAIIASTKAMIGDKGYRIGPSAIGARDNPYGKGVLDNPDGLRICLTDLDPRQRGLFNASWTLGYYSACAYAGVQAVALGASTGPFGFIHRRMERAAPYYDSADGRSLYPAFHVMAGLAAGCGRTLIEARASEPGAIAALVWREGGRRVVWLANLRGEPTTIRIAGGAAPGWRLSVIDAESFGRAATEFGVLELLARPFVGEELTLDAYAVARLV
ncbi:MAG: hypothetical protein ABSG83_16105 [Roseiarcus sp.]